MRLRLRASAVADLDEAYRWYEDQRTGLGEEFMDAGDNTLAAIEESPRRYRVVALNTRRAIVRRFPYSVFYRVMGEEVVVVACFHGSRDPRNWKSRR